ncbi:response regulator [Streptomyces sp. NPDC002055]|uniref:response regulator n=1 Tax=Streptomyces sp. NPDC002055 TaxID=3154534 RepID=UPI0033250FE5
MMSSAPADDRASILLVDDMEDNLDALEAVLGGLGEPLVRAGSGEEAVNALQEREFAVVLLDVVMPGMDGFETAASIRRQGRSRDVPIIFLTGTGTGTDRGYAFRGYATGAADFVTKPFDPWVLRAKVGVFLDLHRKNRQLQRLLARDREQLDTLAERLASIESCLATGRAPDTAELRAGVARMEEALRELRSGR